MFSLRWLPWKFMVRKLARAHGFLDPIVLLSQLQRFTQPSEVQEPVELLRAGAVLHARGLVNSRVIQHNLDWLWPYWVEQQFDPRSVSFIPRAFSITHINLTQRNWTAVGVPDNPELPIVDPRGLMTPLYDQWSLDTWVLRDNGEFLLPSRLADVKQSLSFEDGLNVTTLCQLDHCSLQTKVHVEYFDDQPFCVLDITVESDTEDTLVINLRPYNPEGISFIDTLTLSNDGLQWTVNNKDKVIFDRAISKSCSSNYQHGDVFAQLREGSQALPEITHCDIGMLTAAALIPLQADQANHVRIKVPLESDLDHQTANQSIDQNKAEGLWNEALAGVCKLSIPDSKLQHLYDSAIRTLILHSVDKVYPGPYTYKRFWYRDATFIIYALTASSLIERAEKALDYFPEQQTGAGYFHSQEGEWDSNGQALWIFSKFCQLTGRKMKSHWQEAIDQGAKWLAQKRTKDSLESAHAGLLPAGFSAEHLGPNDHYYWDDYWAHAGLSSVSKLAQDAGDATRERQFAQWADDYAAAIDKSLQSVEERLQQKVLPASPYRRLDAGAIGSIVCGYPLRLSDPSDASLLNTIEFLLQECMVDDGFFQDMIHSGINPYLTLHIAQILLRAGDQRFYPLLQKVASLASSTGQWPEAIHPHTGGGCMGDGQHAWAAAEWIMMLRCCFVREEGDSLIFVSGIMPQWWRSGERLSFGPAPTEFGTISINVHFDEKQTVIVDWEAAWHDKQPQIKVSLPGFETIIVRPTQNKIEIPIGELI